MSDQISTSLQLLSKCGFCPSGGNFPLFSSQTCAIWRASSGGYSDDPIVSAGLSWQSGKWKYLDRQNNDNDSTRLSKSQSLLDRLEEIGSGNGINNNVDSESNWNKMNYNFRPESYRTDTYVSHSAARILGWNEIIKNATENHKGNALQWQSKTNTDVSDSASQTLSKLAAHRYLTEVVQRSVSWPEFEECRKLCCGLGEDASGTEDRTDSDDVQSFSSEFIQEIPFDRQPCEMDPMGRHTCEQRNICLVPSQSDSSLKFEMTFQKYQPVQTSSSKQQQQVVQEAEPQTETPQTEQQSQSDHDILPLIGCPPFTYGQPHEIELWIRKFNFDFPCGFSWPWTSTSIIQKLYQENKIGPQIYQGSTTNTVYGTRIRQLSQNLKPMTTSVPTKSQYQFLKSPALLISFPDSNPPVLWHFLQFVFGAFGAKLKYEPVTQSQWSYIILNDQRGWLLRQGALGNWHRRMFELIIGGGQTMEQYFKMDDNDSESHSITSKFLYIVPGQWSESESEDSSKVWTIPGLPPDMLKMPNEIWGVSESESDSDSILNYNPKAQDYNQYLDFPEQHPSVLLKIFWRLHIAFQKYQTLQQNQNLQERTREICFHRLIMPGWSPTAISGHREAAEFRRTVVKRYPKIRRRRYHVLYLSRNSEMLERVKNTIILGEKLQQTQSQSKQVANLASNSGRSVVNEIRVLKALQHSLTNQHLKNLIPISTSIISPLIQIHTGLESFETQVQLFSEAGIVISTFMSGLSNMVFMSRNAQIIVITSPGGAFSHQQMAASIGHLGYTRMLLKLERSEKEWHWQSDSESADQIVCAKPGQQELEMDSEYLEYFDKDLDMNNFKHNNSTNQNYSNSSTNSISIPKDSLPPLHIPPFPRIYPFRNVSAAYWSNPLVSKTQRMHLLWHCSVRIPIRKLLDEFSLVFSEGFSYVKDYQMNEQDSNQQIQQYLAQAGFSKLSGFKDPYDKTASAQIHFEETEIRRIFGWMGSSESIVGGR